MNTKKLWILCLSALLASTAVQAEKLRIGVEGAYPPFSMKEADGTLKGFDIDMALEMCKRLNRECVLVEQEFDGFIPALLVKKYDAIVASLSITEERKKKIDFTDKYYNMPVKMVAKANANFPLTDAGMKGKRIGVLRATIHQCVAEKLFPSAILKLYNTQDDVFQDLANGRLDAEISDSIQANEGFLKQDLGKGFAFNGPAIVDKACQGTGVGIAVRQKDAALRDAMSKAIQAMRADGTYKKINDKYFDFDIFGN